jgi:hypothetical protein
MEVVTMKSKHVRRAWAYALYAGLMATATGCGNYQGLPEYTGAEDGDACGPCGRGKLVNEVCALGELEGLIEASAGCANLVHVDVESTLPAAEQNGSLMAPYSTLTAGLEAAGEGSGGVILLAGDGVVYTQAEPVVVGAGVHVLGGYTPGTFETDLTLRPIVSVSGDEDQVTGLIARSVAARTVLARLGVQTTGPARTHIGALLEDSPLLELVDVEVIAAPGADGTSGEAGSAGSPGGDGGDGGLAMRFGSGGVNSRCDRAARRGGDGGVGAELTGQGTTPARAGQDAGSGASGGDAGASGFAGVDGQAGEAGAPGEPGVIPGLGAFEGTRWLVEPGEAGTAGLPGNGGGGGGGGEVQNEINRAGAGGGGGAGGCAGTGGEPGTSAGSSFGALIVSTAPVFVGTVKFVASDGGDGGIPGAGGVGGAGGAGGAGGGEALATAGAGGSGGAGGDGGQGSPGAPGHSVAAYCLGGTPDISGATLEHGAAGAWAPGTTAPMEATAAESLGCGD